MESEPYMQVYLLRHGIAEELRSGLSDADRALTQDGRRKLRQTLRTASDADVQPTLILTSPLKRAMETAEIAQKVLAYKGELVRTESLLPDSSVEGVWRELRTHRDQPGIVLVGHNPLFADLAGYLLGAPDLQVDVKKGSILRIDFDSLSSRPKGILRWFLTAKFANDRA
jgi:phosphohistidine phosphatase